MVFPAVSRANRPCAGLRIALSLAPAVVLAGCHGHPTGAGPSAASSPPVIASSGLHPHVSDAWGFRIEAPPGWTVRQGFPAHYLANDAWKTFAGPRSRGTAVLALTMPGSNRITDAEIRIGASRDREAVQDCTKPPPGVRRGGVSTRRIHGVTYTYFEAADAAMSHRLEVHAYRAVHANTCYAIDLLVFGTNPQVYDPPASPPFTDAHAFEAMHAVLETFRFDGAAAQAPASASTARR